jgi:hypothetical protein
MIDWKLQSRSHGCQACGKSFADKQSYFTLLVEHRHELVRQDVCAHCWEAKYSQGAKDNKEFISFWQGVFNQAPPAAPEAIQKESAESLLRKLIERANPEYAAACFILAVMLERKRIFKVKAQSTQNGRRTIIYEHPKTGDVFTIADPDLHLDKLFEVQRTVSHLLENGLPSDGSTPAVDAALAAEAASIGGVPPLGDGLPASDGSAAQNSAPAALPLPETTDLPPSTPPQENPAEPVHGKPAESSEQTSPESGRASEGGINTMSPNSTAIGRDGAIDAITGSNDSFVTAA